MQNIPTEWLPPETTPLPDRLGEYEMFPHGRRWWFGNSWSAPYAENEPDPVKNEARRTASPERVRWRGLEHRFVRDQRLRTAEGDVVTVLSMRRGVRGGWQYQVAGVELATAWLDEDALLPTAVSMGDRVSPT